LLCAADGAALYAVQPEFALPYLVYFLAHRPGFDGSMGELQASEEYFMFVLEPLIKHHKGQEENYDFMYTLVESIKQTEDALVPHDSRALYMLAELLLQLITRLAHINNRAWKVQPMPNVKLPATLFRQTKAVNRERYLPKNYQISVREVCVCGAPPV
jgi:hypothetical protein